MNPARVSNSTHTNQTEQRASQRISPVDNDNNNNRKLISIHEDLWNRAYKELKADPGKEKYIKAYEQLVSDIFLGRPTNSSACAEPIHGPRRDTDNAPWTADQLQHIIQKGLERVNASQKRIDSTSEVFGVVQNLKPIFNAVLNNTPHTALPWAIISSAIDVGNPLKYCSLYDGVNHVVDRMQWYSKITDSLLQTGSDNGHLKLEKVRKQLETGMLDMYKCMLFYEIKSVCFYHKSQVAVFVRGLLNVDDWYGSLAIITEQENALRSDLQQYKLEQILTIIDQMAIDNKTRDGADDKYRQCLKSLGVVNPMLRTKDIIARKNEVLKDCYEWVFQTKAYQDFMKWQFEDTPNLLWIQGQAGTSKTMLLAGIIEELNRIPANSVSPATLHFFFQDKDGQVDQIDDQVLASGSQDLTLKLWNLTQGTRDPARDSEQIQPQQVNSQPDMIATIDISPDEQQVAAGLWGGVVTLWDLKTGKLQYTLKHTRSCTHVVFTPDSQQRTENPMLPPEHRPTYWVDWKCIEHGNMLICGTDTDHVHSYEFQMEEDLT
ncbi:NACHT and WD40 domain protein [Aspergillus nomiae NRRL 13137]|uniref:NACHT and WD40 domain protein n=1 Tax=Aspergillus nomiae NRRL (strain ATCC 15546 / NRRL 13137 / CBS 260.88 / M93) TaxID=1509407 RepID=A0A0L1J4G5_ASPN3|nr:NACHT and WD40 domain protein [Aspergillus nomiae NRRL 13137]KNG86560.1 NACHT and WD40 domain protein [Aspergillus nomiae NRRL 13137]